MAPLLRGSVQVVYGNCNRATTLRGATPTWFEARPWPVTMGRPLADEELCRSGKVVLLAHGVAKNLFGKDDPTGRTIRIDQVPFTVIGVLEEKGHSLGGEDLDDQVVVPLTTARKRILGFFSGHPTAVGGLTLRVADGADMDRTRGVVRDLLRERHRLASNTADDFILRDLAAAQRVQSRSAFLLTLMLAGAAAVCSSSVVLEFMNLMLVSVSERRLEIGLRMAIGARRREIGLQFLIEAGLLALLRLRSRRTAGHGWLHGLRGRASNLESADRNDYSCRDCSGHVDHGDFRAIPGAQGRAIGSGRRAGTRPGILLTGSTQAFDPGIYVQGKRSDVPSDRECGGPAEQFAPRNRDSET